MEALNIKTTLNSSYDISVVGGSYDQDLYCDEVIIAWKVHILFDNYGIRSYGYDFKVSGEVNDSEDEWNVAYDLSEFKIDDYLETAGRITEVIIDVEDKVIEIQ